MITRRDFLNSALLSGLAPAILIQHTATAESNRPNIILAMSDDQGWGDTSYNGHPHLKTPTLDEMARTTIRFKRFYSASPVCSPTRASCLTGRNPQRMGIFGANSGDHEAPSKYPLPHPEITLAEVLKAQGYATGHFGKWHLGDLRGDSDSIPAEHGFDEYFSTRRKVPTLDPYGYYINEGEVTEELKGDDSKIIMDRALKFIQKAHENDQPFFVVIWFHTPHWPFIADEEHREMYKEHEEHKQHYWGSITAMDEQLGRLRRELRGMNSADNTMLWFCSDNGSRQNREGFPGSNKHLRNGKGTLYEGGIRVPALLEWPARFPQAKTINMPCCTSDFYPTIIQALRLNIPNQPRPIDGISLLPALEGEMKERPSSIAFELHNHAALLDEPYKLLVDVNDNDLSNPQLYNLENDPSEKHNLAGEQPQRLKRMMHELKSWRESCRNSLAGDDY